MNRPLTFQDLGAIWAAILAITLLVQGCTTNRPTVITHVPAFTRIKCEQRNVQALYEQYVNRKRAVPLGYCDQAARIIVVPYAGWWGLLPLMWVQGHEVEHLPELGGNFHE